MDDVQSWWEVPCIAHFCSLFRLYFDLLDFDIEELEEALLSDSVEEVGNCLLQDLIVRLVKGCFNSQKEDVTTSNYQMYLRRLFRIKCEEGSTNKNPLDRDVAFHSLPLRTKVEILHDLCDFRLDTDDVLESLKSLEAESLRVQPLGQDSGGSTYWYFYGTRLYREDYTTINPTLKRKKKKKGQDSNTSVQTVRKWNVVCCTEEDWQLLTLQFRNCKTTHERNLHQTLKDDFLPELPRLFAEKEKLQRKRMMEQQLKRNLERESGARKRNEEVQDEEDNEDQLRRRRLEQEEADRMLALEMQREEGKSRLYLRERRGVGSSTFISPATISLHNNQSKNNQKNCDTKSTTVTSKYDSDAKVIRALAKKTPARTKKVGRMTNNSMSASLSVTPDDDENVNDEGDSDSDSRDPTYETKESRSRSSSPDSRRAHFSTSKKTKAIRSNTTRINHRESTIAKVMKGKAKDKAKSKVKVDVEEVTGQTKTKVKGSVLFSQTAEDIEIGMHKVIETVKGHRDAWPFVNPVQEEFAPNYYRVIANPMDLQTMEDKLDNHEYASVDDFKTDFQFIVDNCRKYNGPNSEYTEMAETLFKTFNKAILRYVTPDESDEEINVEFNIEHERKHAKDSKKTKKKSEYVKENKPRLKKKESKSQKHSRDKRKRKMQLMGHHSRKSMEATVETLKDMNKWLDKPSKDTDSWSSHASGSSEKVDQQSPSKSPEKSPRKQEKVSKKRPREHNDSATPPRKILKTSDDGSEEKSKKSKISKEKEKSKEKSKGEREKSKEHREKDKHHHRHHKHQKSRSRSSSNKGKLKATKPAEGSKDTFSFLKSKDDSHSCDKIRDSSSSVKSGGSEPAKAWIPEEKKPKPPVKRASSANNILARNNAAKMKLLRAAKILQEYRSSKMFGKAGSLVPNDILGGLQQTLRSIENSNGKEQLEKKKCLLINDPADGHGGPRLSLGSVLPTDAIKLADFCKDDVFTDDDDELGLSSGKLALLAAKRKVEQEEIRRRAAAHAKKQVEVREAEAEENKKEEEVEEEDRKLEPSKGFNRDKSLPNLSAWIKAFGGPNKNDSPAKKTDNDKSKFKVMGKGIGETSVEAGNSKSHAVKSHSHHMRKKSAAASYPTATAVPSQVIVPAFSVNEEAAVESKHLSHNEKHRNRRRSTSSLSSQSESGSPSCFSHEDSRGVGAVVVNPPRWVDEHWGPQTQSPSASSQVSSQSPAGPNSPFSPTISSPPHTPQTPPRPQGPVRVGFYQDTTQHSSPEKMNDSNSNSNSNVASPSTPPTPNSNQSSGIPRREVNNTNSKTYPPYATAAAYVPRYSSSTPSPNVAPGSNSSNVAPSPPPSGNTGVESPSSNNAGSPQSPNLTTPGVADYRVATSERSYSSQTSAIRNPSAITLTPYPAPSLSAYTGIIERGSAITGSNAVPETAHSHPHLSTAQKQYDSPRYAHTPQMAHQHHHQSAVPGSILPVSSAAALSVFSAMHTAQPPAHSRPVVSTTGMVPNQPQPSPFPSSPYTSNPRNINVAPSVYNNPMSELTLSMASTVGLPTSASVTSRSSRNSRSSASAESSDASRSGSSPAAVSLDTKIGEISNTPAFQWPQNLVSLNQIVNSIPNPMGISSAYRAHYEQQAENMSKFARQESSGYPSLSASTSGSTSRTSSPSTSTHAKSVISHPHPERSSAVSVETPTESRKSKGEKSSRSQSSKSSSQPIVPGSAFNFSSLTPGLYPKEMPDPSALYGSSSPTLNSTLAHHHRDVRDLYPTSTSNFHPPFSPSSRTTVAGVSAASIASYQIPAFLGSHPSPYQAQTQPFAHSQPNRGLTVDHYGQFFQGSPHVMGLLPPAAYQAPYAHPHTLGFTRPGWI